jgi:outer membrane protein OmpA-like peptidoglycan-associated protein
MQSVPMSCNARSRGTARREPWLRFGHALCLTWVAGLSVVFISCSGVDAAECLPGNPVSCRPPPSFRTDVIIYSPIPKDQEVVFFSKGAADLSDVAESTLITQAAILRANSSERATVKGYASSDEGDNRDTVLRLSMMRAIAVRDRLVDLGVLAERLTVEAHGADAVIVTKDTEEIRQGLRRVVVFVAPRLVQ